MLWKASPPYLPGWRPLPVQRTISSKLGGNHEGLAVEKKTPPAHKCIPKPGNVLEVPPQHAGLRSAPQAPGHKVKLQIPPPPLPCAPRSGCALCPHTSSLLMVSPLVSLLLPVFIWGHSQRPLVEKTGPRTQWWHSDQPPRPWLIAETPGGRNQKLNPCD